MRTMLFLLRLGTSLVLALVALMSLGCEEENPVLDENALQESNLVPLAIGRIWVFSSYELDTTSSQKIMSSVHRESSYVEGMTTFSGKSAYRVFDSTYTPTGALDQVDTSYLALENGDLAQWDGEHEAWLYVFKKSAGLNAEYVVGEFQELHEGIPVNVTFKGMNYPKEAVSAPIGTVQAYKVKLTGTATVGGIQVNVFEQYFYFADGYGPVRMYTPVQTDPGSGSKVFGSESLLVSKNF